MSFSDINFIKDWIITLGILAVYISIILVGINMVLKGANSGERSFIMQKLGKLVIGSFIVFSGLMITGFLVYTQSQINSFNDTNSNLPEKSYTQKIEDEVGNFMVKAITLPIDLVNAALIGSGNFDGLQAIAGFESVDNLIFNGGTLQDIDLGPFSKSEWRRLNYGYASVVGLTGLLMYFMVVKTGFSVVLNASTVSKATQLKEDIMRWLFSIFIVAMAPLFMKFLFYISGLFTLGIYNIIKKMGNGSFFFEGFIQDLTTGNIFTTAIVKSLFLYNHLRINVIFKVRKIVLTVMYLFIPFAAYLWGINSKIRASKVCLGELITNAFRPTFYAFTFFAMMTQLSDGKFSQWFESLVWMFAIITISETLVNTLQGFFTALSGINEATAGRPAIQALGKILGGSQKSKRDDTNSQSSSSSKSGGSTSSSSGNSTINSDSSPVNSYDGVSPVDSKTLGDSSPMENPNTENNSSSQPIGGLPSVIGGNDLTTSSGNINAGTSSPFSDSDNSETPKYIDAEYAEVKPEDKQKENADRYNTMLTQNMNKQQLKTNVGEKVGNALDKGIGFDNDYSTIAKGIGYQVGKVQKTINTGKAIYQTASQIAGQENLSKGDAVQKLFQSNSGLQTFFRGVRYTNASSDNNFRKCDKLLAQWHPYTQADSFSWK